ncbi:hypothetical protein [Streptomyces sp. NPDC057580]|uniref:hypothetical protein n=1 Tax=Streptomyces sp. NPDC057580 TaxID=3346173 RepID=UPI003683F787
MVHVDEYERADGTRVKAHSRWAAGARREMTILAVITLMVLGVGSTGSGSDSSGSGKSPRPRSTVVYPIKFPGQNTKPASRPTPTVSYPIRWDRGQ